MSGGEFSEETAYRARGLSPVMVAVSLVSGTAIAAPAFVETDESIALHLACFAFALAFVAHGLFRGSRQGLYTDRDGVRLYRAFGTRRFAWREIERFEVVPDHPLPRIEPLTADGRAVRVPRSARARWSGTAAQRRSRQRG